MDAKIFKTGAVHHMARCLIDKTDWIDDLWLHEHENYMDAVSLAHDFLKEWEVGDEQLATLTYDVEKCQLFYRRYFNFAYRNSHSLRSKEERPEYDPNKDKKAWWEDDD